MQQFQNMKGSGQGRPGDTAAMRRFVNTRSQQIVRQNVDASAPATTKK
jgi:hypothetical protein